MRLSTFIFTLLWHKKIRNSCVTSWHFMILRSYYVFLYLIGTEKRSKQSTNTASGTNHKRICWIGVSADSFCRALRTSLWCGNLSPVNCAVDFIAKEHRGRRVGWTSWVSFCLVDRSSEFLLPHVHQYAWNTIIFVTSENQGLLIINVHIFEYSFWRYNYKGTKQSVLAGPTSCYDPPHRW